MVSGVLDVGVLYRKHGVKLLSYPPPPQNKKWRGINPRWVMTLFRLQFFVGESSKHVV